MKEVNSTKKVWYPMDGWDKKNHFFKRDLDQIKTINYPYLLHLFGNLRNMTISALSVRPSFLYPCLSSHSTDLNPFV